MIVLPRGDRNDCTATYRDIWLYCHLVRQWWLKWLCCHVATEMIVLPSGNWNDCTAIWWQKWLYCHLVTEMIVLTSGDWNDCTAIWWLKWLYFLVVTDRDSCCDNPVMEISWCMFQEFHRAGGQVPPITGVVTSPAKPLTNNNSQLMYVSGVSQSWRPGPSNHWGGDYSS